MILYELKRADGSKKYYNNFSTAFRKFSHEVLKKEPVWSDDLIIRAYNIAESGKFFKKNGFTEFNNGDSFITLKEIIIPN